MSPQFTKCPSGKYRRLNSPPKGDSSPLDEEILHQSLLSRKTDISIHLSWSSFREATLWFNFTNEVSFGYGSSLANLSIVSEIIVAINQEILLSLFHSLSLPEMDSLSSLWPYLTIPLLVVEARPSLVSPSTSLSAPVSSLYYFPLYLNHFWYTLSENVVKSFHTFLGRRPWGTRFFIIVRLYSFVQFCHILWISWKGGIPLYPTARHPICTPLLMEALIQNPDSHSGYYSCRVSVKEVMNPGELRICHCGMINGWHWNVLESWFLRACIGAGKILYPPFFNNRLESEVVLTCGYESRWFWYM